MLSLAVTFFMTFVLGFVCIPLMHAGDPDYRLPDYLS